MKHVERTFAVALTALAVSAANAADIATVTVDPTTDVGPIKIMNAANNGPKGMTSDQTRSNFYAWNRLRDLGTQVKTTVEGADIRVVAARSADRRHGAALVVRYNNDNNIVDGRLLRLRVPGLSLADARCHLTDTARTYTEVPMYVDKDGSAILSMLPWSFALIEW